MAQTFAPGLAGDAREAVLQWGFHLQITASADTGKTEVVAEGVVGRTAGRAGPTGIIAFTFTKQAASELTATISARAVERLGPASLDRLGADYVAVIRAYRSRLPQQNVPRYETYEVSPQAVLISRQTLDASDQGIRSRHSAPGQAGWRRDMKIFGRWPDW